MALDLNDAPEQRSNDVIPDGSFVRLVMHLKPGGSTAPGADPIDNKLCKASGRSDALGLDAEFTVTRGPHASRKMFAFLTVAGGSLDEKGQSKGWNMTKPTIKAMVDSALGLDPKDMSEQAKAARRIQGFSQLHGIEFWGKTGVEPGQQIPNSDPPRFYDPKSVLERVVVLGDPEFALLQAGQEVAPKPKGQAHVGSGGATAVAQTAAKPAWGGSAPAIPLTGGAAATSATAAQTASAGQTAPIGASPSSAAPAGPAWLRG